MALLSGELNTEQKATVTKISLDGLLTGGAKSIYCYAQQIWTQFWRNPEGLSCQQVFDSFGTDALAMARLLSAAKALVDQVDPTIWKLRRLGAVTPVLDEQGHPTGAVTVILDE